MMLEFAGYVVRGSKLGKEGEEKGGKRKKEVRGRKMKKEEEKE